MPDLRRTGQIDDFERPDETPLSYGGRWLQMAPTVLGPLRLRDGTAANDPVAYGESNPGIDFMYWTPRTFPNDTEVWGYPTGGEAGAALTGWRLGFCMASTVPGPNFSGYIFLRATALGDFMIMRRYTNGAFDTEWNGTFESYKPILMVRRIGDTIEALHCSTADGLGTWTTIVSASDSGYHGPWRLCIGIEDGTNAGTGWAAIGGGANKRGQIYRRLRNVTGLTAPDDLVYDQGIPDPTP